MQITTITISLTVLVAVAVVVNRCSGQEALIGSEPKKEEKSKETEDTSPQQTETTTGRWTRKEFNGEDFKRDLDAFVNKLLECRKIPAAVVSVLKLNDNEFSYSKGYGRLDPACASDSCEKANENSKFCIGSITKGFTAGVLGKLLWEFQTVEKEMSRFKYRDTLWDTPLKQLLPCEQRDFFGGDAITEKITVRDLLAHRMGLPAGDLAWFLGMERSRTEIWKNIHQMEQHDSPLASTWRSSFMYNNWIYALAGHVSETLSNKTWEDLVQMYYFNVLGMKSTTFADKAAGWSEFARFGYLKNDKWKTSNEMMNLLKNPNVVAPAGAICSTGSDMIRYLRFLLSNNTEPTGVPRNIIMDTFQPSNYLPNSERIISKPNFPVYAGLHTYGFGWYQGSYREYRTLSNAGGIYGYVSDVLLFPDEKLGIFVSTTNSLEKETPFATMIAMHAADLALGEEPWIDNRDAACSIYPEAWMPTPNNSADAVDGDNSTSVNYVCTGLAKEYRILRGVYQNSVYSTLTITPDEDDNGPVRFSIGRSGTGVLCEVDPPINNNPKILKFKFDGVLEHYNEPPLSSKLNATIVFHETSVPDERPTATVNLLGKSVYSWVASLPTTTVESPKIAMPYEVPPPPPKGSTVSVLYRWSIATFVCPLLTLILLPWKII